MPAGSWPGHVLASLPIDVFGELRIRLLPPSCPVFAVDGPVPLTTPLAGLRFLLFQKAADEVVYPEGSFSRCTPGGQSAAF